MIYIDRGPEESVLSAIVRELQRCYFVRAFIRFYAERTLVHTWTIPAALSDAICIQRIRSGQFAFAQRNISPVRISDAAGYPYVIHRRAGGNAAGDAIH